MYIESATTAMPITTPMITTTTVNSWIAGMFCTLYIAVHSAMLLTP